MPRLTHDDIISRLREDIRASENVRDIESEQNAKSYEYYRAKTMHNEVAGRSKIVSSDVFETVEWILPALMDIFSSENGIPEFEPVGPEDVDAAEAMTELVRYQFWRQNDGESILRGGIKDSIMYRPGGIIKYGWEKVASKASHGYRGLAPEEVDYLIGSEDINVIGIKEETDSEGNILGFSVDAEREVVEFDGPRFYLIPQNEFLRHPNAKTIDDSPFVSHKKKVTADHLRRMGKSGFYKNYEKAIADYGGGGTDYDYAEEVRVQADDLSKEEEPSNDPARKMYDLYESYIQIDEDGDGILENRIIVTVGDVILRDVENPYQRPPFVLLKAIEDTHKFANIPPTELVEDIQRLRTFLLRQMVNNMQEAGDARKVFDPTRINMADLMSTVKGPIRTKAGVRPADAIMEFPIQPLNPVHFTVLEYATQLAEQRTGVTKANKGVGDQYQQTATGQLAAINQASQRVRQVAKIIGSGMSHLFRAMVLMNKKFLTKAVAIRLNEKKFLQISPDDLEGNMDLLLNVVLGSQSRQQTIINMQQLLAVLGQLSPLVPGVLDAGNTKSIITEIVKAMGYKNQDRFLPAIFQQGTDVGNQALQQKQLQQAMMEGGAGGGTGGETIGSIAGGGQGAIATVNPAGAGGGSPAWEPGAGGMVGGLPS